MYSELRRKLVEKLAAEGYIRSPAVRRAFMRVPREEFVPARLRHLAYVDTPLPTLKGQTISAPHMCALMCELLSPLEGEKILEIGTGSGYHAALCAEVVAPGDLGDGTVVTVEIEESLARFAVENLRRSGYYGKVNPIVADGSVTLPLRRGFDKAFITAACPSEPHNVLEVVEDGGVVVAPVGTGYVQELVVYRLNKGIIIGERRGPVIFVPLRGAGVGGRYS